MTGAGSRWAARLGGSALCCGLLVGCVAKPAPPLPTPRWISPFDDAPSVFSVPSRGFSDGAYALVRVCLGTDHQVTEAVLLQSSGNRQFDEAAEAWARQVKPREDHPSGTITDRCGEVRVELRRLNEPRAMGGSDTGLG